MEGKGREREGKIETETGVCCVVCMYVRERERKKITLHVENTKESTHKKTLLELIN